MPKVIELKVSPEVSETKVGEPVEFTAEVYIDTFYHTDITYIPRLLVDGKPIGLVYIPIKAGRLSGSNTFRITFGGEGEHTVRLMGAQIIPEGAGTVYSNIAVVKVSSAVPPVAPPKQPPKQVGTSHGLVESLDFPNVVAPMQKEGWTLVVRNDGSADGDIVIGFSYVPISGEGYPVLVYGGKEEPIPKPPYRLDITRFIEAGKTATLSGQIYVTDEAEVNLIVQVFHIEDSQYVEDDTKTISIVSSKELGAKVEEEEKKEILYYVIPAVAVTGLGAGLSYYFLKR